MTPSDIGIPGNRMVLGKHSGRHAFDERLKTLGFGFGAEDLQKLFSQFKNLADRKKTVSDADLEALAHTALDHGEARVKLRHFSVLTGFTMKATCTVSLERDGELLPDCVALGDGPIAAAFNAVNQSLGVSPELETFHIASVTSGEDALGEVTVRIRDGERRAPGRGLSTDIIRASIDAYLSAINRIM
jgi:2-isopropylmalate synthase